ncbi:MAG: RsmB/NOP family class I SAM-dependent RNA methyltransferase [Candidatus Gracilibacteria bacterium]|nr:RsmB/NOP family class I SAM-dependent RNA methyltransferase [Candidatus Gracilibacteria bacterium]
MSFLPEKFLDRLKLQFPEEYSDIRKTFIRRPPVLRTNLHLISAEDMEKNLKKQGFELKQVPNLPYSFIVTNKGRKELTQTPEYAEGKFYIQSIASQMIVWAMDPKPGEIILDVCAAPGSKTSQIAMLMNKEGELIANDQKTNRYKRMKGILRSQQLGDFVQCKNHKGQSYPNFYPEYFDKILVDPSCSSEATFVDDKQNTIHFWSPHKIRAFAKNQKRLIEMSFRCLKPGGTLLYSTCTLSPHENEWLVSKILKKFPEVTIDPIQGEVERLSILPEWNGKIFDTRVQDALRLKPTAVQEGFFMVRFKKLAHIEQ